jgi:hypothetical protein
LPYQTKQVNIKKNNLIKSKMKVHSFNLKNFKKVKDLEACIGGSNVFIMGKNESGKSSVIQALYCLATGKELPPNPITTGKQTSTISMEIGGESPEYSVSLEFNDKNPKGKLTVTPTSPNAKPIKAARTFLDDLIGGLLFDPFEFIKKSSSEQVKVLKNLLKIDWDKLDVEYKWIYELRTACNKEATNLEGALTRYDVQPHEIKLFTEAKDLVEISKKVEAATRHNKTVDQKQLQMMQLEKDVEKYKNALGGIVIATDLYDNAIKILDATVDPLLALENGLMHISGDIDGASILRLVKEINERTVAIKAKAVDGVKRIARAKEEILKSETELKGTKDWLLTNKEQSITEINKQYQDAVAFNVKVKTVGEYSTAMMEIEEKQMVSKQHTARLNEIISEKLQMLADAKINPVQGLTIDVENEQLLYNGLAFDERQISKSKIIAIGIELMMAHNPKLRICRIKDGSLFDKEHLATVIQWINEQDFQAFVEEVDESEEVRVEISEL